jgi:chromosome segregation ATPase
MAIQIPSQGLVDLAIVVEIAKDPKRFEEAVKTLTDARAALYDTVEKKAKYEQVEKLLSEAAEDRRAAREEATRLIDAAQARKKEADDLFSAREKLVVNGEAELSRKTTDFEASRITLASQLEVREKNALTKENGLVAREKKLSDDQQEVNNLLSKNKELNENLSDALKRLGVAS